MRMAAMHARTRAAQKTMLPTAITALGTAPAVAANETPSAGIETPSRLVASARRNTPLTNVPRTARTRPRIPRTSTPAGRREGGGAWYASSAGVGGRCSCATFMASCLHLHDCDQHAADERQARPEHDRDCRGQPAGQGAA